MAGQLLLLVFAFLMVLAAAKDAMSYTIPNWLSGVLALAFPMAALFLGMSWMDFGLHALTGLIALMIGIALFAPGWIGGGDAKLFAAAALWFGWPDAAMFLAKAALMGGLLAVGLMMLRRAAPATGLPRSWLTGTLLAEGGPAPYGIALAAGALWTLPDSQIFLLAAL
ncbi:prepilin peptidase [Hyphobacterium sp. HN65]|uniref:Prepilin peptidase n=1 Tax=Hyphobacterium lacteum TaxID=3116575 RepID=A0ABU7LNM4_9PROT|nr:prepilin peptidase [Hyphobacterium sp. HN65]MEE2525514.1 prepilin peptidase [Hyphobacterium sp. HN65]